MKRSSMARLESLFQATRLKRSGEGPSSPGWTVEGVHDRALGKGRVRFAGFTPKRIDRNLRKFDTSVRETPRLLEIEDARFMPLRRCLYRADGARIGETRWTYADPDAPAWESLEAKARDREDRLTPERMSIPAERRFTRIKEPVLFLGDAKKHYGHFVTDGLSRAWALEAIEAGAKVFFAQAPGPAFERPYVQAVWEALGVGPERVIAPDAPLAFDRLVCPIPAIQLSRRIYRQFDQPHRRAAAAIRRGARGPGRPVYLSRRGLGAAHREIDGEAALEARLEAVGYLVVRPETLSLAAQMAIFDQDEPVIGVAGSALHTLLFRTAERPSKIGVLTPEDVPGRFLLIDMLKGSDAAYINAMIETTEAGDRGPTPLQQRAWRIDVDRAMALFDGAGFFRRVR